MKSETVEYHLNGKSFQGFVAYQEGQKSPRPCVIVAHAWKGLDTFAKDKAKHLAELGFVGFAADLYGDGKTVESNEEASALMMPLFVDRKTLRERIVTAYQTAAKLEFVDTEKMGAIGFCFGGLTVLELLRSGEMLSGCVTFHALLGNRLGDNQAKTVPSAPKLHGSLLILHGYQDPLVSQEDIHAVQKEFSSANVDWQMHIYGSAVHAFTNPDAHDKDLGLLYHQRSEERALRSMKHFFQEVF